MNSIISHAAVKTANKGKTRTATRSRVTFDSTRHRNRFSPAFAAGLLPPTYWAADYRHASWTADDVDFAAECFRDASVAEIDAEEQAYHEMLDAMAFEDAAVSRLSRGHCL